MTLIGNAMNQDSLIILCSRLKWLRTHMRIVAADMDRAATAPDSELPAHAQELRGAATIIDTWIHGIEQDGLP